PAEQPGEQPANQPVAQPATQPGEQPSEQPEEQPVEQPDTPVIEGTSPLRKPIWLELLEREDRLVVLSHLLCQPLEPRNRAGERIALCVSFAADHVLHVVIPDLLLQL